MPTLRRWFEQEYRRLDAEGKSALADCFQVFNQAYFEGGYRVALDSIRDVRELAAALDEPAWGVVVDYYAAMAASHWRGDLGSGLELATRAVVRAERAGLGWSIPALYAREALLLAWLDTDGPGYAGQVEAALDELSPDGLRPDVAARFSQVRAQCLAARGEGQAALTLALRGLPALEWPPAYQHNLRASALAGAGRHAAAAQAYRAAIRGFEELGHHIERNGARLGLAEVQLTQGHHDRALAGLAETLESAERSINRAHVGLAQGLTGQAWLGAGQPDTAAEWLSQALDTLDGLDWLRTETEMALWRLKALRAAGVGAEAWQAAFAAAQRRAGRLKSADLRAEIDRLSGG